MSRIVSNEGRGLPFLLEGGPGPSDQQRRGFHGFLRQLRKELIERWCGALTEPSSWQLADAVDYLVHLALLDAFVRVRDQATAISPAELLTRMARPSIRSLHRAIVSATEHPLLRCIFALSRPACELSIPAAIAESEWADRLGAEIRRVCGATVPTTVFGDYHQLCVDDPAAGNAGESGDRRHDFGVHYTPAPVVDYLTDRALRFMVEDRGVAIDELRILDPSCGCGAFLIAAFRFLMRMLDTPALPDRLRLLSSGIYGCDIDRVATLRTIQCLLLTAWESHIGQRAGHELIGLMPALRRHIACRNFLHESSAELRRPNVILGGPPFVRVEQLHKGHADQMDYYRRRFATARTGQFDLYMLFVERALELLEPGGCLALSVSGSFLRNKSGRALRHLISSQCRIVELVEFDDRKVYPDATTHLTLLTAWKTDNRPCSRYVSIQGVGQCRAKLTSVCHHHPHHHAAVIIRPFPSCALTGEEWRFEPPESVTMLRQMESAGIPLESLPVEVSLGVCTGADGAFVLRYLRETASGLIVAQRRTSGKEITVEHDAVRPILRGRGISGFGKLTPPFVCVFPYDQSGAILGEAAFRRTYPLAYEYLESQRPALLERWRHPDHPWYALRKVDVTRAIAAPKLVTSVMGRPGGFAIDDQGVLCHQSVLTVLPNARVLNPYFLLGVLNSLPMRIYMRHRMLPMGAERYACRLEAIRRLPILVPGQRADSDLRATIAHHAKALSGNRLSPSRRRMLLRKVDRLVMQLYGLPARGLPVAPEAAPYAA